MKDTDNLFMEPIAKFSPDMWTKYIKHVEKLIDDDWKSERLDDISAQEFIINLAPGDTESECESDTSEEYDFGIAPLQ